MKTASTKRRRSNPFHGGIHAARFVALHTPERQRAYLTEKMRHGSRAFMLTEGVPRGSVSVRGSLIEIEFRYVGSAPY